MKSPHSKISASPPVREAQIRASLLLKDLRATDAPRNEKAMARFRAHPPFSSFSPRVFLAKRASFQRKHALAVVAMEFGFPSWNALKTQNAISRALPAAVDTRTLFKQLSSAFLNRWFRSYDEAKRSLETQGGFLFPFGSQFFICEADFLHARGIDATLPEWESIGFDWLAPRDAEAKARLEGVLVAAGYGTAAM